MRHTVKLPKLADSSDDVVVLEWLVAEGSTVTAGQPLLRVETAKAEVDVECPLSGTVVELLVDVDAEVMSGSPIVVVSN